MKEDLNLKELPSETIEQLKKIIDSIENDGENPIPDWFDGKKMDEVAFCSYFLKKHPIRYVYGKFYDIDGCMDMGKLEKEILGEISIYIKSGVARKVSSIVDALRITSMSDSLPLHEDRVHFANGTYLLEEGFVDKKEFCANRLPVAYNAAAPPPVKWMDFLNQLLYPEDIPTLQEFMGYSMIPTTRAQVMLLLIGNGGEGKSRIGIVMRSILGDSMNICSLDKLARDRFCRADQEGMLLMVDDDMKMEALPDTNILKAVVTMEDKMDLERKGQQSIQGSLYVRLMGFGNGTLSSLYDRSDGFYRRQIVLQVMDRPPDRVDDRMLVEKLITEKESIAIWCIEGLQRLLEKGYHFTISDRAKNNLEEAKKEDDNFIEFFESEGYIRLEANTHASTRDLYAAYKLWCEDNLEKPRSERSFSKYLKMNALKMGITYDKNIDAGAGKKVRGYYGIHSKVRPDSWR